MARLTVGDKVRVSEGCPIDFEGAGPVPGDVGEVVDLPGHDDDRHLTVRFYRVPAQWLIPRDYLDPVWK